ncbi:hypothetical protein [Paenibacillus antarcticus]|uniref:Uncharacterized protein n=1 Tax=Paenibacillus antarcticus TaxID=253703 RepID=A0A168R1Z6_9BACL|nr:hypothetical protein [Paenibacillus antarcticus]OAB48483.1 hypothetical protein PBAT_02290 [Paenibacillus antarcticus]
MSRDPRDWQADMELIHIIALKDNRIIDLNKQAKQLAEDNARWTCQWNGAEQKYLTQSNVIAELREQVNRANKALQEIIEYSKHDGISKHLDNCYVTARHAISTLYPLDREDTNIESNG